MIAVKLFGGLGNQLFQYALGRSLSILHHQPLYLDTVSGFLDDFYQRNYQLNIFKIKANTLNTKQIKYFQRHQSPLGRKDKVFNYLDSCLGKSPHFVHEKHYHFDPMILSENINSNTYFSGYWQSEKYFDKVSKQIREDLTFARTISEKNKLIAQKIQESNTVCLHIRALHGISAGQKNNEGIKFHGMMTNHYYQEIINYIAERQENLHFFVFADNFDWVRENLQLEFPFTLMEGNTTEEDLQLMSLCKHQLIPNSTFSWWAAWLNTNPHKIVVAPNDWFADKTVNTQDIYPLSWIRM
jgi:hypothetical protein